MKGVWTWHPEDAKSLLCLCLKASGVPSLVGCPCLVGHTRSPKEGGELTSPTVQPQTQRPWDRKESNVPHEDHYVVHLDIR